MIDLRIELIDPIDENGHYNPKEAKRKDFIIVSIGSPVELDLFWMKNLITTLIALLTRNGILPED